MAEVEYDRQAEAYERARGLERAALAHWRDAIAPWLAALPAGKPLLDGGAGTGTFARAFDAWFAIAVVALEPAAAMRSTSLRGGKAARVRPLGGRLDDLPLADASCGAAWLSTVIHHVPDLARCARELRRVLGDGAPVLIRGGFPERSAGITLLRFFPEAQRRLDLFPTVERVQEAFAPAGFAVADVREVAQTSAASLTDFRARVVTGRHADTLLASLDDATFARGLERLDVAVAEPHASQPIEDRLTLLVLR